MTRSLLGIGLAMALFSCNHASKENEQLLRGFNSRLGAVRFILGSVPSDSYAAALPMCETYRTDVETWKKIKGDGNAEKAAELFEACSHTVPSSLLKADLPALRREGFNLATCARDMQAMGLFSVAALAQERETSRDVQRLCCGDSLQKSGANPSRPGYDTELFQSLSTACGKAKE